MRTSATKRTAVVSYAIRCAFAVMLCGTIPAMAQDTNADDANNKAPNLDEYIGSYGPRHIYFENGALHYLREGMPSPVAIESAGADSFVVVVPPGAEVRGPGGDHVIPAFVFRRDAEGQVNALALVNPDGTVLGEAEKDEETRPRPRAQSQGVDASQ